MSVEPRGPPFGRLDFGADIDFACLRELMRKRGVGAPQRSMSGCGWRVTSWGRAAMARLSGVSGVSGVSRVSRVSGCGCRVTSRGRRVSVVGTRCDGAGTPRQRREARCDGVGTPRQRCGDAVRWRGDAASMLWGRNAMARGRRVSVVRRTEAVRRPEAGRAWARTTRVVIRRGGVVRGGASREWRASFARQRRGSRCWAMSQVARRAARARIPASSSPSRRTRRPTNTGRFRAAARGARAFDGLRGRKRARFGPHVAR
jgi:hypothetical protein